MRTRVRSEGGRVARMSQDREQFAAVLARIATVIEMNSSASARQQTIITAGPGGSASSTITVSAQSGSRPDRSGTRSGVPQPDPRSGQRRRSSRTHHAPNAATPDVCREGGAQPPVRDG
jgi:hypothetical protein